MNSTDKMTNYMLQAVMPFKDKLFRYAYQILGSRMAAEDVVQEVLIKVWKKREEIDHIDNKEAWCMTVTRNLAIDKLRRKKHYHDPVENHISIADRSQTPDERLQSSDVMSKIKSAINTLPPDQQQVIHLRDVEGYRYKEIAEITNLTVEQVKVYLHRARITLRKKLVNLKR